MKNKNTYDKLVHRTRDDVFVAVFRNEEKFNDEFFRAKRMFSIEKIETLYEEANDWADQQIELAKKYELN